MKLPSGATCRSVIWATSTTASRPLGSDREEVARAGVGGRVAELRHRARLDLADALAREVEELADLFEGSGFAAVEPEAQGQDLTLALVERGEQLLDLVGQQCGGCDLERRLRRAILDDVAELGVAVLTERLREREGLGREAQRLGDLVLGHLD